MEKDGATKPIPKSLITCSKCEENLQTSPKESLLLSCLHSFCKECVKSGCLPRAGDGSLVECPKCNSKSQKQDIGCNLFFIGTKTDDGVKEDKCVACDENVDATSHCVQCDEMLCNACVQAHRRVRITKDHTIQTVTDAAARPTRPVFCQRHRTEKLRLFCEPCERLTCRLCQLESHKDHKYCFMNEAADTFRLLLRAKLRLVEEKRESVQSAIGLVAERADALDRSEALARRQIRHFVDQCVLAINGLWKSLCSDLSGATLAKRQSLQRKRDDIERFLGRIEQCREAIEFAVDSGSDAALLCTRRGFLSHLNDVLGAKCQVPNPSHQLDIRFQYDSKFVADTISRQGTIFVNGQPLARGIGSSIAAAAAAAGMGSQSANLTSTQNGAAAMASALSPSRYTINHHPSPLLPPPLVPQVRQLQTIADRTGGTAMTKTQIGKAPLVHTTPGQLATLSATGRPFGVPGTSASLASTAAAAGSAPFSRLPTPPVISQDTSSVSATDSVLFSAGGADLVHPVTSPVPAPLVTNAEPMEEDNSVRLMDIGAEDAIVQNHQERVTEHEVAEAMDDASIAPAAATVVPGGGKSSSPEPQSKQQPCASTKDDREEELDGPLMLSQVQVSSSDNVLITSVISLADTDKECSQEQRLIALEEGDQQLLYRQLQHRPELQSNCASIPTSSRMRTSQGRCRGLSPFNLSQNHQEDDMNEDYCAVCHNGGELVCCDTCPKVYHLQCHVPELSAAPSSTAWSCSLCVTDSSLDSVSANGFGLVSTPSSSSSADEPTSGKRKAPLGLTDVEIKLCERVLLQLFCHKMSVAFHLPVQKTVPNYHRIIKEPMDFTSIKKKLQRQHFNHYMTIGEFVADVNLVFANCLTYNLRESELGACADEVHRHFVELVHDMLPHLEEEAKRLKKAEDVMHKSALKKKKLPGSESPVLHIY